MKRRSLEIRGVGGRVVPNAFTEGADDADHLAVIFPGWAYSCERPLLYYTRVAALEQGADVLTVDYGYNVLESFDRLSPADQHVWFERETAAALAAGLAQKDYARLTLIGKSIGSQAVGRLLGENTAAGGILLTPTLQVAALRDQVSAASNRLLVVLGTGDDAHQPEFLDALGDDVTRFIIEGADHALEIPGDAAASLNVLATVTASIAEFLAA